MEYYFFICIQTTTQYAYVFIHQKFSKVVLGVTYTNPFFVVDKLIIRARSLTQNIFDTFTTGRNITNNCIITILNQNDIWTYFQIHSWYDNPKNIYQITVFTTQNIQIHGHLIVLIEISGKTNLKVKSHQTTIYIKYVTIFKSGKRFICIYNFSYFPHLICAFACYAHTYTKYVPSFFHLDKQKDNQMQFMSLKISLKIIVIRCHILASHLLRVDSEWWKVNYDLKQLQNYHYQVLRFFS